MTEHVDIGILAMFREGLLAAGQAADIQAHLAGCEHCGQANAQLGMVTGLLAAAGPPAMPPGLSARIETALAAESAARAAGAAAARAPHSGVPDSAAAGTGVPGPREPSHQHGSRATGRSARPAGPHTGPGGRRPARHGLRRLAQSQARLRLLAAAAAIVVVGGGGYALTQLTTGGAAGTSSAASSGSGSAHRHPAESGPIAGPAAGVAPGPASPGGEAPIWPVTSRTDYTRSQFAAQVRAVLQRYPAGTASQPSAPAEHPPLTAAVAGCVHAVIGGQHPRLVDIARYQGRQAIIIVVAGTGNAPARAWVTAPDCSAARPHVLARFTL